MCKDNWQSIYEQKDLENSNGAHKTKKKIPKN